MLTGMLFVIGVFFVSIYITYDAARKTDSLRSLVPAFTEFETTILAMTSLAFEKGKSSAAVLCLASPADCAYWLQFVAFKGSYNVTFILESSMPRREAIDSDTRIIVAASANSILETFLPEKEFLWNGNAMHLLILLDEEPSAHVLRYLWKNHWIYRSMLLTVTEPEAIYSFDISESNYRRCLRTDKEELQAIFERAFPNLRNETVKVILFHHKPTSILLRKSNPASISSYIGFDVSVLGAFAKYLNFEPKIQGTSDKIRYGAALENGSLTGTIADLATRKADIAFNGHFTMNFSERVQLSDVYSYDFVCVVVPKAGLIPKWRALVTPFDVRFLIATAVVMFAIAIAVRFIRFASVSPSDRYFNGAVFLSTLLSMPNHKTPTASYHRIVLLSCSLWSVVVVGAFQGFLVKALTVPKSYPDINTLQELSDSKLEILSSYKTLDLFPVNQRLRSKLVYVNEIERNVMAGKAWTGKMSNLHLKIMPSHHIMKECPQQYFLSYVVTAGSPFLQKLNRFIRASHAAGLTAFWNNHKNNSAPARNSSAHNDGDNKRVFSLQDLQAAFLFLSFCHIFSLCVFLNEVLKRKGDRKKQSVK